MWPHLRLGLFTRMILVPGPPSPRTHRIIYPLGHNISKERFGTTCQNLSIIFDAAGNSLVPPPPLICSDVRSMVECRAMAIYSHLSKYTPIYMGFFQIEVGLRKNMRADQCQLKRGNRWQDLSQR